MTYKLYHSKSAYLSLNAVKKYLEDVREQDSQSEYISLDAEHIDPQQIVDILSSQNLFTQKRIILLKRILRNKNNKILTEKITTLIEEQKSDDTLIIWEDQKVKSNTKYYKFFNNSKNIEEIPELNKRTFLTYAKKEIEENGLKIDSTNIKELSEKVNYDPERLNSEIKKFKLNGDKKIIEEDDIEELTTDTLEKDIWDLIDSINNGDKKSVMSVLEKLSAQSVDPNYTLSMLARNLRLIYLTKTLVEKRADYKSIASSIGVPPFTVPSLIKSSSNYSFEKIKNMYSKLSNLDYQIKKGKIDPTLGLTLICPYL